MSIPQCAEKIKSRAPEQVREPWYDWVENWIEKKETAQALSSRIAAIGGYKWGKRAERMYNCADYVTWQECGDCSSRRVTSANLCRDRLCPTCQWRLARKKWAVLFNAINELTTNGSNYTYHMATLTCANCKPYELRETLKEMATAWNRILQRKKEKTLLKGWARSVEVTYNKANSTLHPHYHVIIAAEQGVDVSFVLENWCNSISRKTSPKAQEIHVVTPDGTENDNITEALSEVCKYLNKESDLFDMKLSTLKTYAEQIAGLRLTAMGGIIKKIVETQGTDLENIDSAEGVDTCQHCGSASLAEMCMKWAQGYYHIKLARPRVN